MTEKELIEGCCNRDMGAREELYRRYLPKMFGVCYRLVGNRTIAEDLVHDGFMNVFMKINDYRGTGSFEGWLRHVFVNISLDYLKKNKHESTLDMDNSPVIDNMREPEGVDSLGYIELMNEINCLPDNYRVVLTLYCVEGYNHEEIAKLLKITSKTSKNRLIKARNMMTERIGEYLQVAKVSSMN